MAKLTKNPAGIEDEETMILLTSQSQIHRIFLILILIRALALMITRGPGNPRKPVLVMMEDTSRSPKSNLIQDSGLLLIRGTLHNAIPLSHLTGASHVPTLETRTEPQSRGNGIQTKDQTRARRDPTLGAEIASRNRENTIRTLILVLGPRVNVRMIGIPPMTHTILLVEHDSTKNPMAVNLACRHAIMAITLSKTQTLTGAPNPNRIRNRNRSQISQPNPELSQNRHGNRNQRPSPPDVDARIQIPVTPSGTGRKRERNIPQGHPPPKNQWTFTPSLALPRPLLLQSKSLLLPSSLSIIKPIP